MATRKFHKAVLVQPGRIDRDLVVLNVHMAADVLLRRWPNKKCPYRIKAMRECLDVIRGQKPPSKARNAFIRAAKEARIYLADDLQPLGRKNGNLRPCVPAKRVAFDES